MRGVWREGWNNLFLKNYAFSTIGNCSVVFFSFVVYYYIRASFEIIWLKMNKSGIISGENFCFGLYISAAFWCMVMLLLWLMSQQNICFPIYNKLILLRFSHEFCWYCFACFCSGMSILINIEK